MEDKNCSENEKEEVERAIDNLKSSIEIVKKLVEEHELSLSDEDCKKIWDIWKNVPNSYQPIDPKMVNIICDNMVNILEIIFPDRQPKQV